MKDKRFKTVLIISLLLNVFFIGHVATFFFMKGMFGPPPHGPIEQFEKAQRVLSAEHQQAIEKIWKKNLINIEEKREDVFSTLTEIRSVMIAPAFDESALEKLGNEAMTKDIAIKELVGDTLIEVAKTLPDEERIKFFEEAMPPHMEPPHHDPHHNREKR